MNDEIQRGGKLHLYFQWSPLKNRGGRHERYMAYKEVQFIGHFKGVEYRGIALSSEDRRATGREGRGRYKLVL